MNGHRSRRGAIIAACMAAVLSLTGAAAPGASREPRSLPNGAKVFRSKGCYECHGYSGQGALGVAPAIARPRLPFPAFTAYVRHPAGQMPPYSRHILSDTDVTAIYAFLSGLPAGPRARDVAMLAPYLKGNARTRATQSPTAVSLYRQHCASCHGAELEGGIGPALRNEAARHSQREIEAIIQRPSGAMPKLFPDPLTSRDVALLAVYIHEFPRSAEPAR